MKKEEEHLKSLGLQRQRCWIERLDKKNSILFENGRIYYENMDKIPPSFLDRFGYPGFQWESVWKNDGNYSNSITHTEIEKEIKNKETSLKQAKENGDNEMAVKLEQQIQELKGQQKNSHIIENPVKNKNKAIAYLIVGVAVVAVLGFVILLARTKQKNPKIK